MRRRFTRSAGAALAALTLTALVASAAYAAAATTLGPTQVTATSAVLHGTVQTAGGTTTWQFQFGTTTAYDKGTPVQQITGSANKSVPVAWSLTGLTPGTTYHYRLVVVTNKGAKNEQTSFGSDVTFKTKPRGKLLLDSTRLTVRAGVVAVPFTCASQLPCNGTFSIDTKARLAKTHKLATIVCTKSSRTFFRIRPKARKTVRVPVRAACISLLRKARHHTIRGKLSSRPRTGQLGVIKIVTLVLR